MIIGSCGYGATGSSVLTDLLREYDDVQVMDSFEFVIPYVADGLQDLEYHLMKSYAKAESCDVAIRRFLQRCKCYRTPFIHKPCAGKLFYQYSKELVDEVTQIQFPGVYTADMYTGHLARDVLAFASKKVFMPKIIEKVSGRTSYLWPCHRVRYSIEPKHFYQACKKYINKILVAAGCDLSKPICLDQPFPGNAPEESFPFFDNPYAVVIDRDPRDLWFDYKYTKSCDGKFMPRSSVKDFVIYYRNMRKNQKTNEKILRIRFEELIYDYDASIKKIEDFLGLGEHKRPKEGFNPERSINNTQQIRLHPNDIKEVKFIERYLHEYLFPFEKYPDVKFSGKPFYGAERKKTE